MIVVPTDLVGRGARVGSGHYVVIDGSRRVSRVLGVCHVCFCGVGVGVIGWVGVVEFADMHAGGLLSWFLFVICHEGQVVNCNFFGDNVGNEWFRVF